MAFYRQVRQYLLLYSFRDYKEYHTDTTVKFTVKMAPEKLARAEEMGIHKFFKLQTNMSTTTMVCCECVLRTKLYENLLFAYAKNKGADQLRCNHATDQRLCYRYRDSTTPLIFESEISSIYLLWVYSPVCVGPGLFP